MAEVDIVPEAADMDSFDVGEVEPLAIRRINEGVSSYVAETDYGLYDIGSNQVLVPYGQSAQPQFDQLVLGDIEPRFKNFIK